MPASAAKSIDPQWPERAQAIPRAFDHGRFFSGSMYVYRIDPKARKINRHPYFDGRFYRVLSGNSVFTTSLPANATLARERNAVNAGVYQQTKQKISL